MIILPPPGRGSPTPVLFWITLIITLALAITVISISEGSMDAQYPEYAGTSITAHVMQHTPGYALGYYLGKPNAGGDAR